MNDAKALIGLYGFGVLLVIYLSLSDEQKKEFKAFINSFKSIYNMTVQELIVQKDLFIRNNETTKAEIVQKIIELKNTK